MNREFQKGDIVIFDRPLSHRPILLIGEIVDINPAIGFTVEIILTATEKKVMEWYITEGWSSYYLISKHTGTYWLTSEKAMTLLTHE